jgi:hypothetical protein
MWGGHAVCCPHEAFFLLPVAAGAVGVVADIFDYHNTPECRPTISHLVFQREKAKPRTVE